MIKNTLGKMKTPYFIRRNANTKTIRLTSLILHLGQALSLSPYQFFSPILPSQPLSIAKDQFPPFT